MTDSGKPAWFIDAWSVIDGYAFASRRPAESIDAEITLFVGPPYFEPEPVASLATALAAARGHFQEHFRHGDDGREVEFESLEQLVEAVRRAYRAGGLDISGTPLPSIPGRSEPGTSGEAVRPADLVDAEMAEACQAVQEALADSDIGRVHEQRLQRSLSRLLTMAMPELVPKFVGESAANMIAGLATERADRSDRAREAFAWIDRARAFGIQVNVLPLPARIVAALSGRGKGFEWRMPELDDLPGVMEFAHPVMYRTSGALVTDAVLPFAIPIPEIFQASAKADGYLPIPTLGHLLAAATADRLYALSLPSTVEIVPLLVLALAQLPAAALPHPAFPLHQSRELWEVSNRAATWLARALPSGLLDGHAAELAIHRLAKRLLGGTNDDNDVDGANQVRKAPRSGPDSGSFGGGEAIQQAQPRRTRGRLVPASGLRDYEVTRKSSA